MQVQRPRRPARGIQDFRILFTGYAPTRNGSRDYVDDPNFWPCVKCSGGGRVRDPALRTRVKRCKACEGTGQSTQEVFKAFYVEEVRKYQEAKDKYDRACATRTKALAKLTHEERLALAWLGVPTRKVIRTVIR